MAELTDEQKEYSFQVWEIKISTIEYRAFDICKSVIDGYQNRLEAYEKITEAKQLPLSYPGTSQDIDALHKSTVTLQILLGQDCLPNDCRKPATLEDALRNAGMDEQAILDEKKCCEEYHKKAEYLRQKSSDLAEQGARVTYDVLMAKARSGEKLTSEEKKDLDWVSEVLSCH